MGFPDINEIHEKPFIERTDGFRSKERIVSNNLFKWITLKSWKTLRIKIFIASSLIAYASKAKSSHIFSYIDHSRDILCLKICYSLGGIHMHIHLTFWSSVAFTMF